MTKLPRRRAKRKHEQITFGFIDSPVANGRSAAAGNYWNNTVGDFFEEASARLSGGHRYTTDSECDYCPDVGVSSKDFIESKASGRGARIILYETRLRKEREWCKANAATITYYVWRHRAYTRTVDTEASLHQLLARTTSAVLIMDIETLAGVLEAHPAKRINRGGRLGYQRGWRFPFAKLLALAEKKGNRNRLKVANRYITNLEIYQIPNDPF